MNPHSPPTRTGLNLKSFQSWHWIFLAAILLSAIAISTFYFSSAQAQTADGTITGLTLTSDSPGTLTVSWDAANPTPTDYRVDWAKSPESYQSWKVDEGHVYPVATATSTTITGLEHDTEYKIRLRARYYRGEHEGKSWGGPWAEATITVAGEPAETPTPEPSPDPTPAEGTIDALATTDDDAGQLVLTWSAPAAPNATPTDYHVSWAKSTEDYPADTTTDGNAHSTTATYTLAGIDYDTDYNVRVRARYTDGENTDSPWNGPWTETTAQVKLPLPMTPNMTGAAVSPASQVYLFWSEPSNDSITGYQILRGPDADNLAIIEDDTGSSSTSYTDTAPPAGQTHTYAVKARNASGLSPLSNTLTASVPEAAEEEQLITARHEDGGNTLVSNLGQTVHSGGANAGPLIGRHFDHAIAFTTGANPFGYHVTSVQIYLSRASFAGTPSPDVSIRADDGAVPGETVLYTLTTTSAVTVPWNSLTFTTTNNFTLQPNTTYWLYATTVGTNQMFIGGTESDDEDTESNTDWRIGDARYSRADGGTWTQKDDFNLGIKISGHPAPAFLVSNLDSPSTLALFSRRTDADRSKFAQAFSAANNENGTPAEFDFDGVTVQLESAFSTASQLADSDIVVTVHKDSGGQPGDLVYTLTSPETYTVPVPSAPVTFSAPPGSILSSGITYWVKFEIAADSTFFTGLTRIDFEFATDNNQVQGPTTYNRWTIGHDSLWSPQTLSWATDVKSIKMSVLGRQRFDTLVSNIDQTFLGAEHAGPRDKVAQSFMTPPGPLGQQYPLHRVHINAASQYPTQATVDLHTDDDGAPGDHLASMIMPGDFAPGELTPADLITVAPRHTNLNPGTRYWIVITNEQEFNVLRISVTRSKAQDLTSLDGWEVDNQKARAQSDNSWRLLAAPIQMAILGSAPFIRTDEADGPDLPGAGHNAHKTGAVVTPGIVSTGHLTPGLDRNHGLYGDYWWLDTKTGHRYRIEVKFGDSQNNDTGGSAWMSFIDPDHDDYPYASGCCEADHNRDDGHTFVHFRRPTDDWNNRYLVHIAAFDKLNHNSRIYNGPYTITMTDITGTEKVATNLYLGTRTTTHIPVSSGNVEFAVSFTTGDHPGGYYKLDRVRMHVPRHEGKPELTLHVNTSGAPGAIICGFRDPNKVQHHRPYAADNQLPVTFQAEHCGRDATLAANTTYWLVLGGDDYFPALTHSDDQQTSRSGWTIGDVAAIKARGSWSNNNNNDTIPVEIWASPTPPPNRHAAGVPLVLGERRVGKTLTADITGITDPEGLSDPKFTYSWIRGDGVDEESITGEESETYTLTDDDVGQRIKTLVTFLDDEEQQETAVGPATSVIVTTSRTLVSNFGRNVAGDIANHRSTGFITGPHTLGYLIDSVTMQKDSRVSRVIGDGDAEIRVYDSTSDAVAVNRKPDNLIMTTNNLIRINGLITAYGARQRVKLNPDTTYHIGMISLSGNPLGCRTAEQPGVDSSSLAGFSVIRRTYAVSNEGMTGLSTNVSCALNISGFELQSYNFVDSLEFTSSPTQPGMYATGEVIEATATLNQAITFDGPPPVMVLQIGDNEREMTHVASASTEASWVFRYTVTANDRDDDGVSFERTAIRAYADADLSSNRNVNDDPMRHVNAVPQLLSHRVSSKPIAPIWYGPGELIQFTLGFSLPVTVVGDPELEFSVTIPTPDNEFASYLRGSGTKELVFSYTVLAVDDDHDGIWWNADSIQLDSDDSITGNFNGLDADLDHTELGRLEDHRIDQNPRAVSQEVTSDPVGGTNSDTYGVGDAITFEVVFNQPVSVNGTPRLRVSITGDKYATYASGNGTDTLTFSYTVLATDSDDDGIYLYKISLDYPSLTADSIASIGAGTPLPAINIFNSGDRKLPGHKVDGSLTN